MIPDTQIYSDGQTHGGPDLPAPSGRHSTTMINSTHVLIAGGQVEGPNEAFILDWQTREYTMLPDQLTRERWNQVRNPTISCLI